MLTASICYLFDNQHTVQIAQLKLPYWPFMIVLSVRLIPARSVHSYCSTLAQHSTPLISPFFSKFLKISSVLKALHLNGSVHIFPDVHKYSKLASTNLEYLCTSGKI